MDVWNVESGEENYGLATESVHETVTGARRAAAAARERSAWRDPDKWEH